MTFILTGGGSGGHITPVLAVAAELKKQQPKVKIIYIGQIGDPFSDMPKDDPNIDKVYLVRAGKFRRFHGEGVKQIFNLPVLYKNTRDFFYLIIGIFQSKKIIKQIKPALVFSRGGYVSVPVSLGAKLNKVPYITHDSDPVPSLANRIIAPWAKIHAVALPKEVYPYPQDKTITTGIPLSDKFVSVDSTLKSKYRQELSIPNKSKVIFAVGGGLGSQSLNSIITDSVPHLIEQHSDLYIIHITGAVNEQIVNDAYKERLTTEGLARVKTYGYSNEVFKLSGAADIVITRAGATNLAEFAVQGKACIVVPASFLTGGHQLKNAEFLLDNHAAIVLSESELSEDPNRLSKHLNELLYEQRQPHLIKLADNLAKMAVPDGTKKIAELIFEQGGHK